MASEGFQGAQPVPLLQALGANVKFIDGMDLPERFALGISGNGPRSFAMAGPVHREILDGGILLHAVVRVK